MEPVRKNKYVVELEQSVSTSTLPAVEEKKVDVPVQQKRQFRIKTGIMRNDVRKIPHFKPGTIVNEGQPGFDAIAAQFELEVVA